MTRCATEFYLNCSNAGRLCGKCSVETFSKNYRYDPIIDLGQQPPVRTKDIARKNIQKRAAKSEANVMHSIKKTLGSGAACGDGDLLLDEMRIECKDRGSRSSWNLTWQEYQKGQRQQIQAYAITIRCPNGESKTMYIMDASIFLSLTT